MPDDNVVKPLPNKFDVKLDDSGKISNIDTSFQKTWNWDWDWWLYKKIKKLFNKGE